MLTTQTQGIFQSDVLIRSMVIQGLADLRVNPWLLDYVFAYLVNDDLTSNTYGRKELDDLKDWFLNSEVKVHLSYLPEDVRFPSISIGLHSAEEESNQSLGNTHYDTSELVDPRDIGVTPVITLGPFTPISYDAATGTITLPAGLDTNGIIPGYRIFDSTTTTAYPIIEVLDDNSFMIPGGVVANFTRAYIAPASSLYIAQLESSIWRETWSLGVHAAGDQKYCLAMDSILRFILLRYKETLLEARGFEVSKLSTGPMAPNAELAAKLSNKQLVYSRYTTISGLARNYWPKAVDLGVAAVMPGVCDASNITPGFILLCSRLAEGFAPGPNPPIDFGDLSDIEPL